MGNLLIVAEKPSVALRIAIALGNNTQKRLNLNGVGYYEIDGPSGKTYIAAAVGHIFTIRQKGNERGYPVLDVQWAPSYEVDKNSYYTKKYLDVFRSLAQKCDSYVNACDYDIEGTVIGTNIIRFAGNGIDKARRMKFSTTTIPDIKNAYDNLMAMDIGNFHAGEVRHMLDWLWGINLSRALTSAIAGTKFSRYLSIGRVQGPTLAVLAKRELEITNFKPEPYWTVHLLAKEVEFTSTKGNIFDNKEATAILDHANANVGSALVEDVEAKEDLVRPYPPFDLTALQMDASRFLRMDPSATLAVAQSLYERAYISYPRTSSQKLPPTLGLPKIIGEMAKNPKYAELANMLISEKRFRPNEGIKKDEAHPAIYPTGIIPKALKDNEEKLYDMIARRFLSCFAPYAKVSRMSVTISVGEDKFAAKGFKMLDKGWYGFYTYAMPKDKPLPEFAKGENAGATKAYMNEMQTQPPKRFGKAGLIAELEKKELGTKATRAAIIDALFRRGYIEGSSIKVTSFGLNVYKALDENVHMIVSEETTKQLEHEMDRIANGDKTPDDVINEGKEMLLEAIKAFDSNKERIGKEMQEGLVESQAIIGKCLKDGGDLVIKRSKAGKQFVACNNYPECTNTYSIPQQALVVPSGKTCEHCKTPIVKIIRRGKGVFEMDLDPNCVTKEKWKSRNPPDAVKASAIKGAAAVPSGAAAKAPKAKAPSVKKPSAAAKPRKRAARAKPAAKAKAAAVRTRKPKTMT